MPILTHIRKVYALENGIDDLICSRNRGTDENKCMDTKGKGLVE